MNGGALHGGLVHRELAAIGARPGDVLDFSVNVNPYGPCREIREAVERAAIDRYPDPRGTPAREALASWLGAPVESLVLGNGAVELLWAAARATLGLGDGVLVAEPAFSEFRRAAELVGAAVSEYRVTAGDDFAFDAAAFDGRLRDVRPRAAHVATPANPTGHAIPLGALRALFAAHPETVFVADLSFLTLSDHAERFEGFGQLMLPNVVWVLSLTKELSIPGVRVGVGVAPGALARAIGAQIPPWSVGAAAQAVAEAAARPSVRRFVAESRRALAADRRHLAARLGSLGLHVHPSAAPYVLVRGGAPFGATTLRRVLLERHGVLVRDATSFGLPEHVRLAVRPASDVSRLIQALGRELA